MERLNLTNLKAARRNCGMSAAQAAKVIQRTKSVIYRYEAGLTDPTIGTLLKLLDAYGGVSVVNVFDGGTIGGKMNEF